MVLVRLMPGTSAAQLKTFNGPHSSGWGKNVSHVIRLQNDLPQLEDYWETVEDKHRDMRKAEPSSKSSEPPDGEALHEVNAPAATNEPPPAPVVEGACFERGLLTGPSTGGADAPAATNEWAPARATVEMAAVSKVVPVSDTPMTEERPGQDSSADPNPSRKRVAPAETGESKGKKRKLGDDSSEPGWQERGCV
ncbi:hypothetical protein CYMTET_8841 [Cymbomonas tetramitiformis]|uniref:Uncharacterized protein n=1 Tax=Cymbomonas tetramitiformis TaxID=36881 RepID=A0AAE0LG35_9CHLO|nr:hypothetical protein CYMTET_8841 [Cymbomonas tetramitiformis]